MLAQAGEEKKSSALRPVLTLIATLLAVGLVIQMVMSFMAVKSLGGRSGPDLGNALADKAYLQDFYQTYGIRAASRAEAELLLADMRRKEMAERQDQQRERQRLEQERQLRRFEEESHRMGEQAAESVRRVEQRAEMLRQQERRQQEERERAARAAEEARIEQERNRWRGQSGATTGD
jgi:membrane protein involved in colicin uptake